jgi:hypothetical protein
MLVKAGCQEFLTVKEVSRLRVLETEIVKLRAASRQYLIDAVKASEDKIQSEFAEAFLLGDSAAMEKLVGQMFTDRHAEKVGKSFYEAEKRRLKEIAASFRTAYDRATPLVTRFGKVQSKLDKEKCEELGFASALSSAAELAIRWETPLFTQQLEGNQLPSSRFWGILQAP